MGCQKKGQCDERDELVSGGKPRSQGQVLVSPSTLSIFSHFQSFSLFSPFISTFVSLTLRVSFPSRSIRFSDGSNKKEEQCPLLYEFPSFCNTVYQFFFVQGKIAIFFYLLSLALPLLTLFLLWLVDTEDPVKI